MNLTRRRLPGRRLVLCCAAALAAGAGAVAAQNPPQPDFYWPYGTVTVGTANIDPPEQPIIALVNGVACGLARTKVAAAGPEVPAADVGKTVYVVDILADAARRGCGRPGDAVTFYLPAERRIAAQRPLFRIGGERIDLDLTVELTNQVPFPMTASDGVSQ